MSNKDLVERSRLSLQRVWKQALFTLALLAMLGVLLYSLTAAWYTNVAETTELQFETESWGFEGSVTLDKEANVVLSPGQDACVPLTVTNDSSQIEKVTVTVDKSTMSSELQKRIYFYVPVSQTKNGEDVERVYLSSTGGYSYRIMPYSTLRLTADSATDTPVRCQWVYDLLGYYVYGTLEEVTTTVPAEGSEAATTATTWKLLEDGYTVEYVRPVEYDYDTATFDKDGKLEMVDEETDVKDFIGKLLNSDGYNGNGNQRYGDYYLVQQSQSTAEETENNSSNTTVTGLWLYLCTQQEIEEATKWDTLVGEYRYEQEREHQQNTVTESALAVQTGEETAAGDPYADVRDLKYTAKICIAGQNLRLNTVDVEDADALKKQLTFVDTDEQTEAVSLRLNKDMTLTAPLAIPANVDVVLDMNGKTLSVNSEDGTKQPVLDCGAGSSVTVLNGTIKGVEGASTAVRLVGSNASFSNVTVEGRVLIADSDDANKSGTTSTVRLSHCTVENSDNKAAAVMVMGNGSASSAATAVLVENCTIRNASFYGICGNGTETNHGTNIKVIDSTVEGYWAGIYQPQGDSYLYVNGSSVKGMSGIVVKGGTAVTENSTVTGTYESGEIPTAEDLGNSGFFDTGAGIYVEANYNWARDIALTINGCTVTSGKTDIPAVLIVGKGDAVTQIMANSTYGNYTTADGKVITNNFVASYRPLS